MQSVKNITYVFMMKLDHWSRTIYRVQLRWYLTLRSKNAYHPRTLFVKQLQQIQNQVQDYLERNVMADSQWMEIVRDTLSVTQMVVQPPFHILSRVQTFWHLIQ